MNRSTFLIACLGVLTGTVKALPFNIKVLPADDCLEEIKPELSKVKIYDMPGSRWNWEGKWNASKDFMRDHLEDDHGVEFDTSTFSKSELSQIHDNIHNGYSAFGNKSGKSKTKPKSQKTRRTPWFRRRF
jgi:hypothetical protein